MKKNMIFTVLQGILFCGMFLLNHTVFCGGEETDIVAEHYQFPFFAIEYRTPDFPPKKKTTCSVSGVKTPAIFSDFKKHLIDVNEPVMVKFITSHNGDSLGKNFEKKIFTSFLEKYEKGIYPKDVLETLFRDQLFMNFSSDSELSALTALFLDKKITLISVGQFVVLLCNKNSVVPLIPPQGVETYMDLPDLKSQIMEISIKQDDKFLIIATPEITRLPFNCICDIVNSSINCKEVCSKIVYQVKNRKGIDVVEDFACMTINVMRTPFWYFCENLRELCVKMKVLYAENEMKKGSCESFCHSYKKICQILSYFISIKDNPEIGSKDKQEMCDLFYNCLVFGFLNFCRAKERFFWLDKNLHQAFSVYKDVLMDLVTAEKITFFSQKQQADIRFFAKSVKLYFTWKDGTVLFGDNDIIIPQNDWVSFGKNLDDYTIID